jgi:RsiW-degrading membrane proteinase PrsW (M82 family)
MAPILSKPSGAAPATMFYITLGAIMTVWSGIWFIYLRNNPPTHQGINYLCLGFLVTGVVLFAIGLALGPLSRWARHAELPPEETAGASETSAVAARRVV